jgi:putrescine importer
VVNLCVIGHYFVRRRERRGVSAWKYLVSPAIGFLVCLWIWLSVSPLAMKVGAIWSLTGIAYLIVLIRRHSVDLARKPAIAKLP